MAAAAAALKEACATTVEELMCPISHDLPSDPVFAEDGYVYDRKCIKSWLKKKQTSPRTNTQMGKRLFEAVQVRNILEKMVRSGAVPQGMGKPLRKRVKDQDHVAELRRKAEQGVVAAMSELGEKYWDGSASLTMDVAQAFKWFQEAADQGCTYAMWRLGVAFALGNGCEQNDVMAMHYYTMAAQGGNIHAMFYLGWNFAGGLAGSPIDAIRAFHWFEKAALHGNRNVHIHIARCYARGLGVDKDLGKARQELLKIDPPSKRAGRLLAKIDNGNAALQEYCAKDWSEGSSSSASSSASSSD